MQKKKDYLVITKNILKIWIFREINFHEKKMTQIRRHYLMNEVVYY